jgi:hypothetical protein
VACGIERGLYGTQVIAIQALHMSPKSFPLVDDRLKAEDFIWASIGLLTVITAYNCMVLQRTVGPSRRK